jgi:prefoldin subunit 5
MKVHRSSQELQDTIEGYKELIKMLRAEIQELKQYKSEVIKLENLLHGYKKVIEDISKSGSK